MSLLKKMENIFMKKNQVYIDVKEKINHETGEVIQSETTKRIKVPGEPNYVRLYFEGLMMLTEVTRNEMKTLCAILECTNFQNTIELTATKRKNIVHELSTTEGNFNKNLSNLVKSGLLKRNGIGEYLLNPFVFGKGQWKDIHKLRENHNAA